MAIRSDGLLMIEPTGKASEKPLIDELTRKMTAAWHHRRDDKDCYRGWHTCVCGAKSDNRDHWVGDGDGLLTNSLCVHYLVYHRDEIPQTELDKVRVLSCGEIEPHERELKSPEKERR